MSVRIGHAVATENGKATGGLPGNQNNRELRFADWYKSTWHTVLRPLSKDIAEKSAKCCESLVANNHVGYDQNQRNTLHTALKKINYEYDKLNDDCECDCSSLMNVCSICAGVTGMEYKNNAIRSANMVKKYMSTGMYESLTDKIYLNSSDFLMRGDILVKNGHTCMVLSNGLATEVYEISNKNYFKKCSYKGYSIVDALASINETSTFNFRKAVAFVNGINGYLGTASQNTYLLNLLKEGNLLKP